MHISQAELDAAERATQRPSLLARSLVAIQAALLVGMLVVLHLGGFRPTFEAKMLLTKAAGHRPMTVAKRWPIPTIPATQSEVR